MKVFAYALFALAALLAVGGFINASKPSISPLVIVIGSFALPAIIAWWGAIILKKSNKSPTQEDQPPERDG